MTQLRITVVDISKNIFLKVKINILYVRLKYVNNKHLHAHTHTHTDKIDIHRYY